MTNKQNPADQREALKSAFDEGYRFGHNDGMEDCRPMGGSGYGLESCWEDSDTRQALSAPPESVAAVPDEQAVFEEWMARVCPSGDVTEVHEQWLASSEYEDWLDGQLPTSVYYWRTKALAYKDRVLEAFENGRKSVLARDPLDVADEQIIHLWDTHVGEPTPSRPFTNADKVNFAHAILYAAHNIKAAE